MENELTTTDIEQLKAERARLQSDSLQLAERRGYLKALITVQKLHPEISESLVALLREAEPSVNI